MREIKFRAWDKEREFMTSEPYYFEKHHYSDENRVNQSTYVFYEDWRDLEDGRYHECELMQFTGLLDKNGKEIYEGDIVHCSIEGDNIGNVDVIQFKDASFWLRYRDRSIPSWIEFGNELEVIGNIHENHELLNQGV